MPRQARTVIEGLPYHIAQRGNRRLYLPWLKGYSDRYGLETRNRPTPLAHLPGSRTYDTKLHQPADRGFGGRLGEPGCPGSIGQRYERVGWQAIRDERLV